MRIAVFSTLFFFIGWATTYWVISGAPPTDDSIIAEEVQRKVYNYEQIKSSAQNLVDDDFNNYKNLKDPRKRFQKGQDILEKVFKLFLANLSIKMNSRDRTKLRELTAKNSSFDELCKTEENGPDVYYNGLSGDPNPSNKSTSDQLLAQCRKKLKKGKIGLNNKLSSSKEKKSWFNFSKKVFSLRNPQALFPHDIHSELWTWFPYQKALKSFSKTFTRPYEGKFHGHYRTNTKNESSLSISVKQTSDSKDGQVQLRVKFRSNIGLYLKDKFEAQHPESHGGGGSGSCRGMVLKNKDDVIMHFIKIPGKKSKGYFGRIYDKLEGSYELVGSFFVIPKGEKLKKSIRWGKDRGYW
ncbi:MAG: hypothetical protein HN509_14045 [Halobacteriovoraceae bacterium]|jgi:hypothetical protein|nr:hypothetical protein [Halobacteriovoraceae bacterium]MBT5095440.1 hypothetical protein [Halobacteriovoraceae bacterium]